MFQVASEVENLKSQMMTLFKELQQAQSKLDEAEGMKKNLQDRLGPHTHTHICPHCQICTCDPFSEEADKNNT